jgi:hypothetical protein
MIDRTHRYPTHLIDVVQLANGSRVVVRPALPQDCELQRVFVRTLSDDARYFRFMTRLSELSEAMAERFTSIDYRSHVALIVAIFAEAAETMMSAVGTAVSAWPGTKGSLPASKTRRPGTHARSAPAAVLPLCIRGGGHRRW